MAKKNAKKVPRNGSAVAAKSRKAGLAPMKDRRTPRGGAKNEQKEILEEFNDDTVKEMTEANKALRAEIKRIDDENLEQEEFEL